LRQVKDRKFIVRNVAWLFVLVVSLVTVEVFLRYFEKTPDFPFWPVNIRNWSGQTKIDAGSFVLNTNWQGLREKDFVRKKQPKTTRIVLIGDSMTFGWGVSDDKIVSKRLQVRLQKRYPNRSIEVVNVAAPGAGVSQMLNFLKIATQELDADYVIANLLLTNDTHMEIPIKRYDQKAILNHQKNLLSHLNNSFVDPYTAFRRLPFWDIALFRLFTQVFELLFDDVEPEIFGVYWPGPDHDTQITSKTGKSTCREAASRAPICHKDYVSNLGDNKASKDLYNVISQNNGIDRACDCQSGYEFGRIQRFIENPRILDRLMFPDTSPSSGIMSNYDSTIQSLTLFREIAQSHGAEFFVTFLPHGFMVDPNTMPIWMEGIYGDTFLTARAGVEQLMDLATDLGIKTYTPIDLFRSKFSTQTADALFLKRDFHFAAGGHELFARFLDEIVLQDSLSRIKARSG